jgi:predicted proteasome-type protease
MTIWNAPNMYEAARIVGEAVRTVHKQEAATLAEYGVDFNISMILGGQIAGERCRLFYIYSAGNFIESHDENTYFQIGEAKYGKPILDRVVTPLHLARRRRQVRADLDGFDAALERLGRPAARPAGLRGRAAWPSRASSRSTKTTSISRNCATAGARN